MLVPDYIFNCLNDISIDFLKKNNIKYILLDVDQTLTAHGSLNVDKENENWLIMLKNNGVEVLLFSNNTMERVQPLAEKLNMNFISMANKPFKGNYYLAQKMLNCKRENMAAIGDQIFSDIFGANRFNIKSILVNVVSEYSSSFLLNLKRFFEKKYIKKYYETKGLN